MRHFVERLMRPEARFSPFLERQGDIAAVYRALPQPHATVYAIGVLAGLRPGEVLALQWTDVSLEASRLIVERQVRHGQCGPTKSGQPRMVPIVPQLAKILTEWRLATGEGSVCCSSLPTRSAVVVRGRRRGS